MIAQGSMKFAAVAAMLAAGVLVLNGCGRKNLPVPPRSVTSPVNADPNANQPASVPSFQRAARVANPADSLTVAPAEIKNNPGAPKTAFPLDRLLN